MENVISIKVSPLQVILSFTFQIWMVVFPIILIRKMNYLADLLSSRQTEDDNVEERGGQ